MAIYTGVTVNYYGKRYGNWRFAWSYILGWVSVVLTFFSGIAYLINILNMFGQIIKKLLEMYLVLLLQVYSTCVLTGCMHQ